MSDFLIENGILKAYTGHGGDVIIPQGVTSIASRAFLQHRNYSSSSDSKAIFTFGRVSFFSQCDFVTSVTIPDSVTSIAEEAFMNCTALTSLTIPDSVTTIGASAFSGCCNLTTVTLPNELRLLESGLFSGCLKLTNITIPDSVTGIGAAAFSNCESLTSITLSDRVTIIGSYAFSSCTSLVDITLPARVNHFGDGVFFRCLKLLRVDLPEGMTSLLTADFSCCECLREITIPDSVDTFVGGMSFHEFSLFEGCDALCVIHASEPVYRRIWERMSINTSDNLCFNLLKAGMELRDYQKKRMLRLRESFVEQATVNNDERGLATLFSFEPLSLVELEAYIEAAESAANVLAFLLDFKNKTYTEDEIQAYEEHKINVALGLCEPTADDWKRQFLLSLTDGEITISKLKTNDAYLTIPSTIGSKNVGCIGATACSHADTLISVVIEDGVTYIDDFAFCDCKNLLSATLPESVTTISSNAFRGCSRLTIVGKAGSYAETYANQHRIPFTAK